MANKGISVETIGIGDKNFTPIKVIYEDGKPVTIEIPNAGKSGAQMYKMNPVLEKAINDLKQAQAMPGGVREGQLASVFARSLLGDLAYSTNSTGLKNTRELSNCNEALKEIHGRLSRLDLHMGENELKALFRKITAHTGSTVDALKKVPGLRHIAAFGTLLFSAVGVARADTEEERNEATRRGAAALASLVDPSGILLSSAVYKLLGGKGESDLEEILNASGRSSSKSGLQNTIAGLGREMASRTSSDHPSQLGAFKMTSRDGKPIDVIAALKDPNIRADVLNEIARRAEKQGDNPPEREPNYKEMLVAAAEFSVLSDIQRQKQEQLAAINSPQQQVGQAPQQPSQQKQNSPAAVPA